MLRIILIVLLLWLPQDTGVKYRIINLSSNEIVIGGQVKRIGDDFYGGEKISWTSSTQTITAVNLATKDIFSFSASQNEVIDRLEKGNITKYEESLSTNRQVLSEQNAGSPDISFFYLLFEKDGKTETVPLLSLGEVEGMGGTVYLVRHDHVSDKDILVSDDFMALEEELTKADVMAKDRMEASGKEYYVNEVAVKDYMDIMLRLTKKYFGDIEYTYNELKILMSTK